MKTIYYLVFLTIFTTNANLNAQEVFPKFSDVAQWNVLECFWLNCNTKSYFYEYDTVFCGFSYSKVNFENIINETGYFRSDSLKTFFRKNTNCSEKEYLIYNYDLNIGDTAFVAYNLDWNSGKDTAEFVLESIDTITQFGVERQRFKMMYDPSNEGTFFRPMYWIKGIGSQTHPFYPFMCLQDGCEQSFQLLCYDSSAVQLYLNPSMNVCDTLITVGFNVLEKEFKIYPNPFKTELFLKSEFKDISHIIIFSSIGNKVMDIEMKNKTINKIDVSSLELGTYFLEIHTSQGILTKRIVKSE